MTIPDIARDACKWEPSLQHNFETSTVPARSLVTCCGCKSKVAYQDSWDATEAFRSAYRTVKNK